MKHLFVVAQDPHSREWMPVARLSERSDGYALRYTMGAARLPGFNGLGRMANLDQTYRSPDLFPFFANRLIPKSRPEYRDYLRWTGLDTPPESPMEILAVTGGIRATDGFQLVAPPRTRGSFLSLEFFARGLRHQPKEMLELLQRQEPGARVYLMKDVQNDKDQLALAIRVADPTSILAGYVPRYYCAGLVRLLDHAPGKVVVTVKKVNPDAPFDMKLLLTVQAECPENFDLLEDESDFRPFSTKEAGKLTERSIAKTDLDL